MTAIQDLLTERGLRCTAQRTALYEALAATATHPTAEELYQMVRPRTRSLSLATVYSTLEVFCRVGLARKLPTTDGSSRFDADTTEHVHLRCMRTGRLQDIPPHLSDRLFASLPHTALAAIEKSLGVRIEGLNIQVLAWPMESNGESSHEPGKAAPESAG